MYMDGLNTWIVEIQLTVSREPHPPVPHTAHSGRNSHLPTFHTNLHMSAHLFDVQCNSDPNA